MSWFHLIFGLLLFVVFTITGRYMRVDFPDKTDIDQTLRILMRSRHIYILLSSLMHVVIGVYIQMRPQMTRRVLQIAGSAVLGTASVLLVYAFAVETYQIKGYSNYSRWGLYLSLAGVGLHLIGGLELPRAFRENHETTR